MSHLATSYRPSNQLLRLLLAYLVLTSALPVPVATAQSKANRTPNAPARKAEQKASRNGGAKDRITPSALQANGKIAFVSDRSDGQPDIFVMNQNGSGLTNIINEPTPDFNPAFSPDGSRVVFTSARDGNEEIYVMNADGSSQTRLTNDASFDNEPAFSPDGGKIVFTSERTGNPEIHVMNSDGSGLVNLTNHSSNDRSASFSPDGSKIVFVSSRDGGDGEIYVMNSDGTNQTRLTTTTGFTPSFSPDGSKIIYTGDDGVGGAVVQMNADGTNPILLSGSAVNPAFSPDGTKIVFESDRDGNDEIYVMDADGTNPTRLTSDAGVDLEPAWQTLLSCAPPPAGGVAWYRAEENALDSIGTNHGTFQNGATTASGFVGATFEFDGVDDQVDIGQLTDLQNAQQLSVMAWVRKRDLNNTIAGIIGKWNGCTGCTDDTFLLYNNESLQVNKGGFVVRFTDDTAAAVAGTTDIPVGQWVHIAATWRSSDGEIKIYKNGRLDGSGTGGAGKTLKYHTNYTAKIGEWGEGHGGNPLYRFGGQIDEATIFNRALSQTEIQNVYDAKNEGKCLASAAQTITASNTNDSGPGSLRQAILDANATPGTQTINFNLPGAGVHTINLASALPAITDAVVIDGATQSGYAGTPLVELNGAGAGAGADGFRLNAAASIIRALAINRFNGQGIEISGEAADGNTVEGCFIGTDAAGTADLGNGGEGVLITLGADNNIIGGATATPGQSPGNLISGNGTGGSIAADGVEMNGTSTTGNAVRGNIIGLDATGAALLRNEGQGVFVAAGASNNEIGGASQNARNIISGNFQNGIEITGSTTVGNAVRGNYIGTDIGGTIDRGNSQRGIHIDQSSSANVVGGATSTPGQSPGNVVSGNDTGGGIQIRNSAANNQVQGNLIGTNASGTAALGNIGDGVVSTGANNLIGGATADLRNIISANTGDGIEINGAGAIANTIASNYIGTDAAGTADLGNGGDGVRVTVSNAAATLTIGGLTATPGQAPGNLISGNQSDGIEINGLSTVNVIGNIIGLRANGTTALSNGNGAAGVLINASAGNTIGGYTTTARNVIAAHTAAASNHGVWIMGEASDNNRVVGNYIGTGINGTESGIGNLGSGVLIMNGADNNIIGGDDDDDGAADGNVLARNVIVRNSNDGVAIITANTTTGNVVQGNFIGVGANGTTALGNIANGVQITGASNTVGGTTAGAGNLIANNGGDGVLITSGTNQPVQRNSIHSNTGLGIDLGANGVQANDGLDADAGANNLQNYPVLTGVSSSGGNTTVNGTFNSTASTAFAVEFYSNTSCDASGNGEGRTFIGSTVVNTNASGDATINTVLSGVMLTNEFVTATATDPAGNTSEFSACQTVLSGTPTNVFWINSAGGAWNVAANWQDGNGVNRVPAAGDDAIIDLAGTYTVTLGSSVTVNSLNLGAASGTQTLNTGNFTLTLNSSSAVGVRGVLVVDGTVNGAGNLNLGGTLEHRGTLSGTGAINLAAAATLHINGSQPTLSRTLNNSGTVNFAVTNSFIFAGGTFNNLAGATFNVQVERLIFQSGGVNLFTNAGTLRKASGAGTTTFTLPFNNNGTVDLQAGTLDFSTSGTSSGQFNGAAGTTFQLNNQTLTAGSSINVPTLVISGGTNSIAGSYNVTGTSTINGTVAITGNVLSVGNLLDVNGRVDFNSNNISAPTIDIDGTLAGSANVTTTATGTINYNGTMLGTGTTIIPAAATLNIGGSQPQLLRTISNSGTANYNVANSMVFSNGTFNNLPGATFNVLAEKLMFTSGGTGLISNTGTVRKLTGTGTTTFNVIFNNHGTVELQSGTLEFGVGGTSSGAFNGAAGTTFILAGHTLQAASSVSAANVTFQATSSIAGTYNVSNATLVSGTTTFNGNITSIGSILAINGTANFNSNDITAATITVNGILSGSANVSPTASGTFNFNGTMSGTGATNIPAGATLNIGGSQPTLSRTVNNSGTSIYNVTNSWVFSNGTFNNLLGGVFDARANRLIFASGGTNAFNNAGTLQKTQGAATTDFNLNVTNSGTVEALTGTLAFNAVYNQSAGTTRLKGGNLSTTSLINIQGGTLSGAGTITGNVQNAGTLAPGLSFGILNITGNYTQLASGTLAIEIGGTTPGAQYDQLNVTGTATLGGTLNATLTGGFNPGFNDQFVVLTYGTRSGTFSTVNAAALTPVYNANNLTLTSNAPPPAVFSVTNTNDAGAGSLRQAIIDSNATPGVQSINFQIAGAGVQTIKPASALPQITDAVVIDGYTQAGASANTLASGNNAVLLVELSGEFLGGVVHGLDISAGSATIKGLVINRFFNGAGVQLSGGSNHRIEGNFIGTDAAGTAARANHSAVGVANSQNNTIGGTTPAARNLLSGNSQGVYLNANSTGTLVQGNYIGTNAAGTAAVANGFAGLLLEAASGNQIGGTTAGAGNLISGNGAAGIYITQGSANNTVQGNLIGTAADGSTALPNTTRGVIISQGSSGNQIGGASAGASNTIAFNGGEGVLIESLNNNAVTGNSIHSNAALGLDLAPVGVTPNDAGDTDTGANNSQNFPTLAAVTVANGNTTFNGTLASAANTTYTLHFYSNAACDASGNGEGQTYLGSTVVTTDASGDAAFNATINGLAVPTTQFVTATATDPAGNTSEFGACLQATVPPGTFTISGQIIEGASGLGGVTVTLSGTQSATTTTDANGNYSFANLASGGNYTVTPSRPNYTFAPPSRQFNNLNANQTASFTATATAITISGQVTENGAALPGVTITLSGTQSGTATTDASGNYSFFVPNGGDYVITPSLTHYTFNPSGRAVNSLTSDLTANFTATRNTHSIGGQIRDNNNAPLAGVTVNLSGGQSATTTTNANGGYSFTNLPAGANYIVTPQLANYAFAPPSAAFNNLGANETANFTGTLGAHTIGGRVADASNNSLANVTVTLSGAQSGTALTDASGNYAFNVAAGASYTVTPSLANYTFAPPSASFNNISANQTANFTGTLQTFSIGGRVVDSGNNGVAGVNVALSGGQTANTTTDAAGNYSFANLPAGANYTVTPQLASYTFVPANATFNNLNANQTANFAGTLATYTVSGRVRDTLDNNLSGVLVTLSGAQTRTATTDANGLYTFADVPQGAYALTPSLANYAFNPPSKDFPNLTQNENFVFTGTPSVSTLVGAPVAVTVGGFTVTYTVVNAAGVTNAPPINATTAGTLPAGYTLFSATRAADITTTAAYTGAVTVCTGVPTINDAQIFAGIRLLHGENGALVDRTSSTDFNTRMVCAQTGTLSPFVLAYRAPTAPQPVGGRVVDKEGDGIGNVTLHVTDPATGASITSVLTDANGNYTLMLPPGGDYTITTAKAGLTFQPASRSFGNLSTGQTSDFTATEGLNISGRVAGANGNGIGNVNVTLSGTVSRTTQTLPNGNFLFTNLPVNGSYVVQADSGLLIFNPLQVVNSGLASDASLNLVAAPRAVAVPTPPIEDGFDGTTRDPLKFTEGTLTQPPGSKDPLVLVVQEGGKLEITPRPGVSEASYNGYVTTRAIDFTDAQASVEINQTTDNGAQTIFSVGRDERNYFRFLAQDVDESPIPVAGKAGAAIKRTTSLRRLIFQARSAGVLNGLPPSIPFDPAQHRYWRFRHSSAESLMFFETSPDRVVWTEQRRIALAGAIGSLAAELSAGTSGSITNPGQAIFDNLLVQPNTNINRANNVRLIQSAYRVNENAGFLTLKAVRAGDTSRETVLDYATEPHDGKPCNTQDGKARARCDFGTTAGTIRFAPGETEKTFNVFITDDIYAEGDETVRIALGLPSAGVVEEPAFALVTIADNDAVGATPHPINTAPFLVRQQYLDFLNREPDENGFNAWVGVLKGCAYEGHFGPGKSGSDPACDRITVSSSFFRSQEFAFKSYFVYRFYKASLGRAPTYEEFLRDMTSVTGQTEAEVVARREAFAEAWVERADFVALNEGITNAEFVDQLATTAGVPIAGRTQLILDLNDGRKNRVQVLRAVVDSPELFNREYNAAFVLMQYFGYLQRDPDEVGYNNWLNLLNRTGDYRTMIFGFLYSQEYLLRFGQP